MPCPGCCIQITRLDDAITFHESEEAVQAVNIFVRENMQPAHVFFVAAP
jgi:hypothetical protein